VLLEAAHAVALVAQLRARLADLGVVADEELRSVHARGLNRRVASSKA
jgi:hypothetical protein